MDTLLACWDGETVGVATAVVIGPLEVGAAACDAEVRAGKQTWDEMFNGYFEWCLADEDLSRRPPLGKRLLASFRRPVVLVPLLACMGLLHLSRRARLRTAASPLQDRS